MLGKLNNMYMLSKVTDAGGPGSVRHSTALACAADIVRNDGPFGLMKGWCALRSLAGCYGMACATLCGCLSV